MRAGSCRKVYSISSGTKMLACLYIGPVLRHLTESSITTTEGAQWLSGRVLDSRPNGRGFEPHRRHCVVVLEQDTFILA